MTASWSGRGDAEQAAMGFMKPNPSMEKSQSASPAIAKKLAGIPKQSSQGVPRALKIVASVAQRQATSTARNQAIEPTPAVQNSNTKKRKLAVDDAGPRKKKDQRSRKTETSEASTNSGGPDPVNSLSSAELAPEEHTLEDDKELLFFWRERQFGGETELPLAAHLLGKLRNWPGWNRGAQRQILIQLTTP